jgi:hypothetical protein
LYFSENVTRILTSVGEKVLLPCQSSSLKPAIWRYKRSIFKSYDLVYNGRHLLATYNNYVELMDQSAGNFSLFVRNVTVQYSGIYVCIENEGQGPAHFIALIVNGW